MRPKKGNPVLSIPITFDSVFKKAGLGNDRFLLSGIIFLIYFVASILLIISDAYITQKIFYIIIGFIVVQLFVRFVVLKEIYYKGKREELISNDYKYSSGTFWNIYEITNTYPHICRYANGLKSVFVRFDKDVIVGKPDDNEFLHFEAISEAYAQMHKRAIDCIHIDYMDTLGSDPRMDSLYTMANKSENKDVGDLLTRVFDYVQEIMENSYATYDVYCFFYGGNEDIFADELDIVISMFLEANYIRAKILNKEDIGALVKSVQNIEKFSVNRASENLFSEIGVKKYLSAIWVERGGERVKLNKTIAEKEAEQETKKAEKDLRSSRKKQKNKKLQKRLDSQELDLFDEDYGTSGNNINMEKKQTTNLAKKQTTNLEKKQATNLAKKQTTNLDMKQTTNLDKKQTTNLEKKQTTNLAKGKIVNPYETVSEEVEYEEEVLGVFEDNEELDLM